MTTHASRSLLATALIMLASSCSWNDPPNARNDNIETSRDTAATANILANDDPGEANWVRVNWVGKPTYGALKVSHNGFVTYTPASGFVGIDSFSYEIYNDTGLTDRAVVKIAVSDGDGGGSDDGGTDDGGTSNPGTPVLPSEPPVAADDSATLEAGSDLLIDVAANDSDPEAGALAVISVTTPQFGTAAIESNQIRYAAPAEFTGDDTFGYTIEDVTGLTATAQVTVSVTAPPSNEPPVAVDDQAATTADVAIEIDVLANDSDPEDDVLIIDSLTQPDYGTASITMDAKILYEPGLSYTGDMTFTYTVIDGNGNLATATVTVAVSPADLSDHTPVALDDAALSNPGVPVIIPVLDNDYDLDGDLLSVVSVAPTANGTATLLSDGTIEYLPDAEFEGVETFSYTITDGGHTADALVSITVRWGGNYAPVAVDDNALGDNEHPIVIPVMDNDYDPDGDALSVIEVSVPPKYGTVEINADNTISYVADTGFTGIDDFIYRVSDGSLNDAALVTVNVFAANHDPIAVDDEAAGIPGSTVVVDVLANDSDPDGDPLTITDVTTPYYGDTVIEDGGQSIRYVPAPDFNGVDSFFYAIVDGRGGSAMAMVTIGYNTPPVAEDDQLSGEAGMSYDIDVLANDSDPDGNAIEITDIGSPSAGTATLNSDGTVHVKVPTDAQGDLTFVYTIADEWGDTDQATVTVSVNGQPVAVDDSASTSVNKDTRVNVLVNDSDPDGDSLTIDAVGAPAHGTAELDRGKIRYTPDTDYIGSDNFTYTISDGRGGSATATVSVDVYNNTPAPSSDNVSVCYQTAETFNVLNNDSDDDGDALSVIHVSAPSNGALEWEADGTTTYTPADGWSGIETLVYTVADGRGGEASAEVVLTVYPDVEPDAVDDTATTSSNKSVAIDVLANDTATECHPITIDYISDADHGNVSINLDDTITYTPSDPSFTGTDSFSYIISDGLGRVDNATVTVTIE